MSCPWSLVSITWIDAFDSHNGWIDTNEYKPEARTVVSVGYLWPDCLPEYVTITGSYFADEAPNIVTIGMVTHIPASLVKIIKIIQPDLLLQHTCGTMK